MATIQIIYASTSGHTEYVTEKLEEFLRSSKSQDTRYKEMTIRRTRVELASAADLQSCDFLILASSTWNTGGPEGQLNPHMHAFVFGKGKEVQLNGKKVAVIGLGDERYHYTCRAADYLENYVRDHGGTVLSTLRILNEPYGQEGTVEQWGEKLLSHLT